MASDLVKRLRKQSDYLFREAADEIERLRSNRPLQHAACEERERALRERLERARQFFYVILGRNENAWVKERCEEALRALDEGDE